MDTDFSKGQKESSNKLKIPSLSVISFVKIRDKQSDSLSRVSTQITSTGGDSFTFYRLLFWLFNYYFLDDLVILFPDLVFAILNNLFVCQENVR